MKTSLCVPTIPLQSKHIKVEMSVEEGEKLVADLRTSQWTSPSTKYFLTKMNEILRVSKTINQKELDSTSSS